MTPKRDTIITIRRKINPDSIKYLICDEIYTAKGDTMLYVRDIPSGMKYTAERARDVDVTVRWDAPAGGSPVGYMVFGDTAKYTAKSTLVLDGQWEPIEHQKTLVSDQIKPGDKIFQKPVKFHPVYHLAKSETQANWMNNLVDAIHLEMTIGFTIYALLSLLDRIKKITQDTLRQV